MHFVYKLLQNANDNSFTSSNPSLKFTYKPSSLRVDCNETGFLLENVEALCTIRKSTKKSCDSANGFTREKGIGFKSVFRSADVVWIFSYPYSFKFDKH